MKKWIIGLLITILIGATSSAVIAGRIYYQEAKTYEDYRKQELNVATLQNIYIDSEVPVSVQRAEGPAYVEFNQKFTDLMGKPPTYALEVTTKGKDSYITVKQNTGVDVWIGVKDNEALCTVYLPETIIDKLSIKNQGSYNNSSRLRQGLDLNLNDVKIKELVIHSTEGNVILSGEYEKVDITQNYGRVEMHSKIASNVKINGDVVSKLTGVYNKIEIQDGGQEIEVDSQNPSEIRVVSYNGNIRLRGSYKNIEVEAGGQSTIDIQSDTVTQAHITGGQGSIKLEGAFEDVLIKAENCPINISTTVIPKRINLFGGSRHDENIMVMLPSNTPGIDITYKIDENLMEDHDSEVTLVYDETRDVFVVPNKNGVQEKNSPISDFPIEKQASNGGMQKYIFGDQTTKIFIETYSDNSLYLLNNGYISDQP